MDNNASFFDEENISKINTLLTQVSEPICDTTCQENKTKDKLKEELEKSKKHLTNAPSEYEIAEKNYYTFMNGEQEYTKMKTKELKAEIEKKIDIYNLKFNSYLEQCKVILNDSKIVIDYNNNLNKQINNLSEKTELIDDDPETDVNTKDRISYYKTELNNKLTSRYRKYVSIYFYIVLIFSFFYIFFYNQQGIIKKIIVIILILIYPFVCDDVLKMIYSVLKYIYNFYSPNNANNSNI